MSYQDPPDFGLQAALDAAMASEGIIQTELLADKGFATVTGADTLVDAAKGQVLKVVSAVTGTRYGLKVEAVVGDKIRARLVTINGREPSERWWRTMMVMPRYDGIEHVLRRADDGNIYVDPRWCI